MNENSTVQNLFYEPSICRTKKRKYGVYLTTSLALRTLEYPVDQCELSHEIHDCSTRGDKR